MKAADIPDQLILSFVKFGYSINFMCDGIALPRKVVLAKVRQMIYKGRLLGCPCGCECKFEAPATEQAGREARARRLRNKPILQHKAIDHLTRCCKPVQLHRKLLRQD